MSEVCAEEHESVKRLGPFSYILDSHRNITIMDAQDNKQDISDRLVHYTNLFQLFKNEIPQSPALTVKVYDDPRIDQTWGQRFTFWNLLLHDSDPQFRALLKLLNSLVAKYRAAYGEERLRSGINNNPFSFLSELIVYDAFESNGIVTEIEPTPAPSSKKKLDFAVSLDNRRILIEVIAPLPREKMIRQGAGFGPIDDDLSEKLTDEIVAHLKGIDKPKDPVIIMVDGVYRALDPINAEASIPALNSRSTDLATFVSAVLLFRSNWGNSISTNLSGLQLNDKEISTLESIFQIPS
jgi:hypothetical protein